MLRRSLFLIATSALAAALASGASAGVVNPDISVIGQPLARWTDAPGDPARKRVTLDGRRDRVRVRRLAQPVRPRGVRGLARHRRRGARGRVLRPDARPARRASRSRAASTAWASASSIRPTRTPTRSPSASACWRRTCPARRRSTRPGVQPLRAPRAAGRHRAHRVARTGCRATRSASRARATVAAERSAGCGIRRAATGPPSRAPRRSAGSRRSCPIGDRSGLELGLSGTQGTNNVAAAARTTVLGADAQGQALERAARRTCCVQGELLRARPRRRRLGQRRPRPTPRRASRPLGGYLFADYNVGRALRRRRSATSATSSPTRTGAWDQALRVFAGLALMEETTVFRARLRAVTCRAPVAAGPDPAAVNTLTLRVIYSMGPHKAHQF